MVVVVIDKVSFDPSVVHGYCLVPCKLDFPKTLYLSKVHFQQYVEVPVGVISVNSVTELRQHIFCPFLPKCEKKYNNKVLIYRLGQVYV